MSRNKWLIGGIVIIAAIVIAYFAFLYPPANREDTSGAIGVANKYRSEQITDRDVMLKDEENAVAAAMAVMSPDEKAAMFERSTYDLQARTLVQYAPEVVAAAMGRADDATLAKVFRGTDAPARIEVLERAKRPTLDALYKSMNVTSAQWAKFNMEEKVNRLAKASDMELAAVVKDATMQEKAGIFFAKADVACKQYVITLLNNSDRAAVMERAPAPVVAEMDLNNFKANFFGKTAPEQQFEMLAKAPEVVATAMGRADDATLANIFRGTDPAARIEVLERAKRPTLDALYKNMNVTSAQWAKFNMEEKVNRLAKASDLQLAAIVKDATMQEKAGTFFAKADVACKQYVITLLNNSDRAAVMERAPAKVTGSMERAYGIFEKANRATE